MFYLFTNLEFGVEFRRVLSGLVRDRRLQATIILSGKTRHRPSSDLRSRWDGVRRAIFIARHDRQLARLWGLPVRTVENINSDRFLARIAASDHGFVAGFNQIFHDQAIQRFASLVNCHPSLLPFYRGPCPAFWCIHNGERQTGYTFHRVGREIDQGEILWQEIVPVSPKDTPESLNSRIAARAALPFERYINSLCGNEAFATVRIDPTAVYAHRVDYLSFPTDSDFSALADRYGDRTDEHAIADRD